MAKFLSGWTRARRPVLSLGGPSGIDRSVSFDSGAAISSVAPLASVIDSTSGNIKSMTFVWSGILNGNNEILSFGLELYPLNTNKTAVIQYGATNFSVAFTASNKTFVVTNNSGLYMPATDCTLLLRSIGYNNTAPSVTFGNRVAQCSVINNANTSSNTAILTIIVPITNTAPVVDLNGTNSGTNVSLTFTSGSGTTILCGSAILTDDTNLLSSITIVGTGITSNDEIIKFGTAQVEFPLNTNNTINVTEGTIFQIAYTSSTKTFVITKSGGGTFPSDNGQALLRTLRYVNDTDPATAGNRVFTITANDGFLNSISSTITITVTVPSQGNLITIDSTWLSNNGPAPYYLDQSNTTYQLATNVTTNGTAFAVIASGITFDLNNNTITFDNSTAITIPNGSFESGTGASATGWDFTNAPNAARWAGDFFHNEIYDGSYSLKFSNTTQTEWITSDSTITLEPNTTYSLSAMIDWAGQGNPTNPGVQIYVKLYGAGLPDRILSHSGGNNRGIQFRSFEFKTGGTSETYNIQVGIVGHPSAVSPFYIDDIKIQRFRTYGVAIGPRASDTTGYPDLTRFGAATNCTVKNGSIIQGVDKGYDCAGVYLRDQITTLNSLTVTVNGCNANCFRAPGSNNLQTNTYSNILTSTNRTIVSRDAFDGTVINRLCGAIYNNTILDGPQSGIVLGGSTLVSTVYNNTISLSAKYTNSFAIRGASGAQIFDNIINCALLGKTARGIMVPVGGSASVPVRVYNNTISVQALENNQEYGGAPLGGQFGIQLESVSNVEIYNNTVTAYGTFGAYAFRMTSNSTNVSVRDNTFIAISDGGEAACISIYIAGDGSAVSFTDNHLITDDGIIGGTRDSTNFVFTRCHIAFDTPIPIPRVLTSYQASSSAFHTDIFFVDTTYEDITSENLFRNAIFMRTFTDTLPEIRAAFSIKHTHTLRCRNLSNTPLPGTQMDVRNQANTLVVSGVTDLNGVYIIPITEFRRVGDTTTNHYPHELTATRGVDTDIVNFDADQIQIIDAVIDQLP